MSGYLFRTRTGELTVHVEEITFLSKDLLPLPEKWHGLTDVELRYRQRYVDLVMNPEVREVFLKRTKMIQSMRRTFDSHGFIEVETPMMQPIAGGAVARPFVTHHNTLDMDLYLRIAPELYLKRLVVGGFDRVYEINRSFRNEGLGWRWNPEFTMLEAYPAYTNYEGIVNLTQESITEAAKAVNGSAKSKWTRQERERHHRRTRLVKLAAHDHARSHYQVLARQSGRQAGVERIRERRGRPAEINWAIQCRTPAHGLRSERSNREEHCSSVRSGCGRAFDAAHRDLRISDGGLAFVEAEAGRPDWTERFEIFAGQMEISNGFSELNDPEDQRRRFEAQLKERERGDEEAHQMDEDYIRALSYGMPPAGGVGIGIDRVCMLLTDSHTIRDVILFPLLRPEKPSTTDGAEAQRQDRPRTCVRTISSASWFLYFLVSVLGHVLAALPSVSGKPWGHRVGSALPL